LHGTLTRRWPPSPPAEVPVQPEAEEMLVHRPRWPGRAGRPRRSRLRGRRPTVPLADCSRRCRPRCGIHVSSARRSARRPRGCCCRTRRPLRRRDRARPRWAWRPGPCVTRVRDCAMSEMLVTSTCARRSGGGLFYCEGFAAMADRCATIPCGRHPARRNPACFFVVFNKPQQASRREARRERRGWRAFGKTKPTRKTKRFQRARTRPAAFTRPRSPSPRCRAGRRCG
jgi:hypothetical protein